MSTDEPGWGGCVGFLLLLLVGGCLFVSGWQFWPFAQDNIQSACPQSGVKTVVTKAGWKGLRGYTVTCLDGTVVRLDYKGGRE